MIAFWLPILNKQHESLFQQPIIVAFISFNNLLLISPSFIRIQFKTFKLVGAISSFVQFHPARLN